MTDLKQWHKEVCSRDGYQCVVCKKDFSADYYFNEEGVNQYVCGHHLQTRKAHPELTNLVSNGICVCFDCHTKIHKGLVNTDKFFNDSIKESEEEKEAETVQQNNEEQWEIKDIKVHYFPNGQRTVLGAHEKLCKCKKFIAIRATGICMSCEKKAAIPLKETKEKKKK